MEGDPHSVIEGMLINAYAIGAQYGYIYVRHEYPLAVKNLGIAINQARAMGLLGKNILGSELEFDLEIKEGAGAFVCGESTAWLPPLRASAACRGPVLRDSPKRRAVCGTCRRTWNNVETFANVPRSSPRGLITIPPSAPRNPKARKCSP